MSQPNQTNEATRGEEKSKARRRRPSSNEPWAVFSARLDEIISSLKTEELRLRVMFDDPAHREQVIQACTDAGVQLDHLIEDLRALS